MTDFGGKRTAHIDLFVSPELELALRRRAESDDRTLSHYICRILIHCEEMMQQEDERAQRLSPTTRSESVREERSPFPEDGVERMARWAKVGK